MFSLIESGKYCLSLYFPPLRLIFRAIPATIITTMTNRMNGVTQPSVVGDVVVLGGLVFN
jgi:hypothetical protein